MGLVQVLWGLSNPNAFEIAEWKGKRIRVAVVSDKGRQRSSTGNLIADEGGITISTRMVLDYGINDEIKFRGKCYVITAIDDSNTEVAPQNTAIVRADYLQEIKMTLFEVNQQTRNLRVETPRITVVDGKVTITCGTLDADIYYTTDGSRPSSAANLYKGGFATTADVIKAIATREGYMPSGVSEYEN